MDAKVILRCEHCKKDFITKGQSHVHVNSHAGACGLFRYTIRDPDNQQPATSTRYLCKECRNLANALVEEARLLLSKIFNLPF